MDFISELVTSTDDEDFAVLLADVECLPDEVLETLAAVLQSCAGRSGAPRPDELDPGRLGRRRPRPARRLARAGLAAPKISGGAVGQADPNDKE